MVGLCGLLLDWRNLVKYKIKLQNVDARLAQNSELAVLGMGRNQLPQGIRAHAARGRQPRPLPDPVSKSAGTGPVNVGFSSRNFLRSAWTRSTRALFVGPRLEPPEARPS